MGHWPAGRRTAGTRGRREARLVASPTTMRAQADLTGPATFQQPRLACGRDSASSRDRGQAIVRPAHARPARLSGCPSRRPSRARSSIESGRRTVVSGNKGRGRLSRRTSPAAEACRVRRGASVATDAIVRAEHWGCQIWRNCRRRRAATRGHMPVYTIYMWTNSCTGWSRSTDLPPFRGRSIKIASGGALPAGSRGFRVRGPGEVTHTSATLQP